MERVYSGVICAKGRIVAETPVPGGTEYGEPIAEHAAAYR
jgi:hypothetical protein